MSNSFKRYNTRDKINKGVRLELADPDTGEATGDWLQLRYSLADDYARAREEVERDELITGESGTVERNARILAPLVAGWSFTEPCTAGNVFEFLCGAPHVHGAIIAEATLEGKLHATPVKSSASGLGQSSSSTDSPTEQKTE